MNNIVAEKRYISSKLGVPYESLSQSYLRASSLLCGAGLTQVNSVIDFTLQTNKILSTEPADRLLDLNDEFVITHFTVGLYKYAGDIGGANSTSQSLQTSDQDPSFTTAATRNLHRPVGAIYNGDLSFTIDRTEFIPNFPVRAFYRVANRLNVPGGGVANGDIPSGANVTTFATPAQTESALWGFYPCEPTKIDGRQTIDLSVNLNGNVSMTDDENVFAVFEARGYLITNSND